MLPSLLGLLVVSSFGWLAVADEVTCWAPDGVTIGDNNSFVPCNKLGITQEGIFSSCCRLDGDPEQRDLCTASGLCLSTQDGILRREYCTDKTWNSAACVKVCLDPKTGGSVTGVAEMTACSDGTGTYCCGHNQLGCCGTKDAIVIPTQASVIADGGSKSLTQFKNATIGLGVVTGVVVLAATVTIAWLLNKNKNLGKQLAKKIDEQATLVMSPRSDQYTPTPQFKDIASPPASPGVAFEMNNNQAQRYSELDSSMVVARSEMGTPPPTHYETSPRAE